MIFLMFLVHMSCHCWLLKPDSSCKWNGIFFPFFLDSCYVSLCFFETLIQFLHFFTHLLANLKLNLFRLSCNVSSCYSFSFCSYGLLLFVMSLTATFCTRSNSFLFFCVIEELHTTTWQKYNLHFLYSFYKQK